MVALVVEEDRGAILIVATLFKSARAAVEAGAEAEVGVEAVVEAVVVATVVGRVTAITTGDDLFGHGRHNTIRLVG